MFTPIVIEREGNSERSYDLFSKMMRDRIIFLQGEVRDDMANLIVSQLLFLEAEDPTAPITLYINSPGGSVTAGLSIKNTMDYITCPVYTVGMGMCASMGAFLLASGEVGNRSVMKDTTVMIHQVSSGTAGTVMDQKLALEFSVSLNDKLHRYLSEYTGGQVSFEEMIDLCSRDNYLTAEKALELGLIDQIVTKRPVAKEEN